MKRFCTYLAGIILTIALLYICSCTAQKKESVSEPHIILGFSQIGNESSWRIYNSASIIQAAEKSGIQLIFSEAQQKQENQIKAIRSFIVYQVDVIAFVPIVEDGWDSVLKEAKDAGIPVIIVDRKIKTSDDSLYAGYIGEDTLEEGRRAASFILDKYKDQDGHFNILELYGTINSSAAKERAEGFREIIGKDKRFDIIYSESGDFLRSRGKEILSQIIAYNSGFTIGDKKIDIIFSHNDAMTLGAVESLEENQIMAGEDVVIVSIDGEQQAVNALKDGKINCVIECKPDFGDELMELVKTVSMGKEIPEITFINGSVFTENDNLYILPSRGY